MPRARMTTKGQITIPKEVREQLGIEAGDVLDFQLHGDRVEMRPIRRHKLAEFRGAFRVPAAASFEEEREQAWRAETNRLLTGDGNDGE